MLLVALTGGIGSGKSLAGDFFEELGAIVVDSDQLARDVVERGTEGFDEILVRFGDQVLKDGLLDRRKLGEIVFADPGARADLEAITHPRIRLALQEVIDAAPEDAVIINQIPLLVETGGRDRFDYIIAIIADEGIRTSRLLERGLKSYEIAARIKVQANDEDRKAIADFLIHNDGDHDHLLRQVENLWDDVLLPRARGK